MNKKLILIFFVFVSFLVQISTVYAIPDTGSIDVNVESMPSLKVELSGPNVIRNGDTASIKIKIFNYDSDENITLNSIKIFDEKNNLVISEKLSFSVYGIKEEDINRLLEIQEEIIPIANKDIMKVNSTLINEMQSLNNQIKSKTFVENFNLNVSQFNSNFDNETNFLFSFEFIKGGTKETVTQKFVIEKKPPLPSLMTRHSPGWFAGDQHVHSEHSCIDSDATIEENADGAKQIGLDWRNHIFYYTMAILLCKLHGLLHKSTSRLRVWIRSIIWINFLFFSRRIYLGLYNWLASKNILDEI